MGVDVCVATAPVIGAMRSLCGGRAGGGVYRILEKFVQVVGNVEAGERIRGVGRRLVCLNGAIGFFMDVEILAGRDVGTHPQHVKHVCRIDMVLERIGPWK